MIWRLVERAAKTLGRVCGWVAWHVVAGADAFRNGTIVGRASAENLHAKPEDYDFESHSL